ncbi:serine/threonine protein kinase [Planctomicrobium sp. SH661]|uniref:serine/threonine protein kinase n=1 Tax=Planctomicrobium sp. SH661 TaxID=3448124 RepID=UPI003F5C23B4
MLSTTESFAEQLLKSRVVPEDQIREFLNSPRAKRIDNPTELARLAIRSRITTRFQAEEILKGRGRRLRVNNYVLLEVLGFGGMGQVYIGQNQDNGERVAMKILGEQFKHDAGMQARFRLEARAGMQVDHPQLVRTLEFGTRDDLYGRSEYMVMELFEGVTLLEGISFSSGPMKWDATCDVVSQTAKGLAYLHERGMVHRDVKPDNILVDMHGHAKLLDFGLTLPDQKTDNEEFTLAMIFGQDCLGTADYIAPEQSLNSLKVDGRADIYSLGCTMYVSLTARRPFPCETRQATVQAHRTAPRPRVDAINPRVPVELVDFIEKMMAIDPAQRPATMEEVRERLKPFQRRRNWAFEFRQVLNQRCELKRQLLTRSRLNSLQANKSTKLNSQAASDPLGKTLRPEENDLL